MRAGGLWHPRLAEIVARLGHGDTLVVADAGLPVPAGVETVHLGWWRGEPRMPPVLRAVLAELVVESAVVAEEARDPGLLGALLDGPEAALAGLPVDRLPHAEFKRRTAAASAVIRTGDDTPYANVLLVAGVPF